MDEQRLRERPWLRRWFLIQLVLEIAIMGTWTGIQDLQGGQHLVALVQAGGLLILFLLGLWLLSRREQRLPELGRFKRWLYRTNHYLQAIILIAFLPTILQQALRLLAKVNVQGDAFLIGALVIYMVMFIPMAVFALGQIQSLLGRLLMLFFGFFDIVFSTNVLTGGGLTYSHWLVTVAESGVVGALAFVVTIGIAMQCWGFSWPSIRLSKSARWWVLILIALISVWFVIFNAFSTGDSWKNIWYAYAFHVKAPTLEMILGGIEPGIAEEWLMRFAVLGLLLQACRRFRHPVAWAVIISSLLFGLVHVTNILGGQPALATLDQVLSAAAIGSLLAAIYLYTKSFLWPVLFHAGVDSLEFVSSGSQSMTSPSGAFDWQITLAINLVFIVAAIFLLTGKRGVTVRENFPDLTISTAKKRLKH
ncbi:CPBP family intramembrane glutamic endopeptidase [Furfurilactobacillus siliginis]|uniref:CAAX amino protease n=1 Tax=Furfurilactobacillus siliginis TaxID=348151 RepID=A0A0R2L450_9LACO|nr:CPBP family intramembrane glutamic endopeptidase [Furfurilactobacillus siliginis]KRN96430.1 membrane-bound protease, caax family [Furfurilactobacillus siliginis]GEK29188.1 CAAX amino protease [Furfurilactobacillus siliginis]